MANADNANLALIAAQYQTEITEVTFDGSIKQLILESNPNRWFVQFFPGQGGAGQRILPGPAVPDLNISVQDNLPLEYKFRDCPSIVTGEFYGNGMLATTVIVVECIYLRG